jgi:hypothetical protein
VELNRPSRDAVRSSHISDGMIGKTLMAEKSVQKNK